MDKVNIMKTCTKCGESKTVTEFYKQALTRDGLQPACKSCANAASAKWRAANPERAKAAYAKWQAANPVKVKEKSYKWKAANPDKVKAAMAAWYASNKEAYRVYSHNRRARKRAVGGRLSVGLSERLFKLQRGKCACGCKQPLGDNYHLDHIMPLALGGMNTDDNIQLLRQRCNNQKYAKHPIDFMQQRGYLL